ncbi:MAG: 50S ribosomal protein L24 [Chloroflexi bacterium]|nr:50S ribosomal protein L24 [Chloroflexota bacterium]|tara:strand:- start:135 stop:455 length:321 start_codon:yes stop_codon:yes gene_type:complete
MASRLKKDDEVLVIAGRDKGKRGKIQRVISGKEQVLVEGVNMVKRHLRAGAEGARQAGIIDKEMPIQTSKLMPICPSCSKPTRIGYQVLKDGTKSRMCKKCEGMFS